MRNLVVLSLLFVGCTSAQRAEVKKDVVSVVRAGAFAAKGALAAIRSNSVTTQEALTILKQIVPPDSDISQLDDEAQKAIVVIQTSNDTQVLEQALETVFKHVR